MGVKTSPIPCPHLDPRKRIAIIAAALLALFLGAMDSLIVSAAMPTIVAELGRMHLYSWVYSVYFLASAVSLPIFGKLANLYKTRTLFAVSITLFITDFRFHGLRNTFVNQVIMRGGDLKDVQELLGHKSISMTLRDSHLSQEHQKKSG
ncbi:MAG: tyrosine-type recombinase/integrase [Desulfobacterales bacterium]